MSGTIFALATTPGRSAVAVVRISGPATRDALRTLAGDLPHPRRATLRALRHDGAVLDEALVLWFPGPRSYTGEDAAELHLHGGPAVITGVLGALAAVGLTTAEPGGFTRRAFENGKLDLPEAEAIADLIDAETEAQRRQAVVHLGGGQSRRYDTWRTALLKAASLLEAVIDFPEEALPGGLIDSARRQVAELRQDVKNALGDRRGRRIRDGYRLALIGAPNAGKSTILNALAARNVAMVTEIAGTTRDVIETPLNIAGYAVIIADTAGLRASVDRLEQEGMRRAQAWAEAADARILVIDRSDATGGWREAARLLQGDDLMLLNKTDLPAADQAEAACTWAGAHNIAVVECHGALGDLRALVGWLEDELPRRLGGADIPAVTRLRHRQLLSSALACLDEALVVGRSAELVAEDVRAAARAMDRLVGRLDTEAVLGEVFASFCIGK